MKIGKPFRKKGYVVDLSDLCFLFLRVGSESGSNFHGTSNSKAKHLVHVQGQEVLFSQAAGDTGDLTRKQ